MIPKKYETIAILITGVLFDLSTTWIGLNLFSGLKEGNGEVWLIYLMGWITVIVSILVVKKIEERKITVYIFRGMGFARFIVGLINVITIIKVI